MDPRGEEVDKHGFPVPKTFDSVDACGPSSSSPQTTPPGPRFRMGIVVAVVVGLVLLAVVVVTSRGPLRAAALQRRAINSIGRGEMEEALSLLDRAVAWEPDDVDLYALRAQIRLWTDDFDGSLADAGRVVQMAPRNSESYALRSQVFHCLRRHAEALADANKAVELAPTTADSPLNSRAYARAVAGVELDAALEDIEKAIELFGADNEAYLDTRGYIRFLQEDYEQALSDLDRAVELSEASAQKTLRQENVANAPPARAQFIRRTLDEQLAVIVFHRGQVHDKLGDFEQAAEDKHRGIQLGYDPGSGVY